MPGMQEKHLTKRLFQFKILNRSWSVFWKHGSSTFSISCPFFHFFPCPHYSEPFAQQWLPSARKKKKQTENICAIVRVTFSDPEISVVSRPPLWIRKYPRFPSKWSSSLITDNKNYSFNCDPSCFLSQPDGKSTILDTRVIMNCQSPSSRLFTSPAKLVLNVEWLIPVSEECRWSFFTLHNFLTSVYIVFCK